MNRRLTSLASCLLTIAVALAAPKTPAENPSSAAHPTVVPVQGSVVSIVDIGSAQPLQALPWRTYCEFGFHPSSANQPDDSSWAAAGYDDSAWFTASPATRLPQTVAPTINSLCWYRLHVQLRPGLQNVAISVVDPYTANEVFVNGSSIGNSGGVGSNLHRNYQYVSVYAIPPALIASGSAVIAIRVWNYASGYSILARPGVQFMATLGFEPEVSSINKDLFLSGVPQFVPNLIGLPVALIALGLYFKQRDRREYLWLGVYGLAWQCFTIEATFALFQNQSAYLMVALSGVFNAVLLSAFFEFFFAFLGKRGGWWLRVFEIWLFLNPFASILAVAGYITLFSPYLLTSIPIPPAAIVLFTLLFLEARRKNPEARLLLLPTILALGSYTFSTSLVLLGLLHFNTFPILRLLNFQVGYGLISIYQVCLTLFWLSTGVFIVMRANRATRHQARLASEMEAARSVQSMLIPQALPSIPGFALASVYRPAQEVGGDFFQVIPTSSGDTLVVLGDVSGKGLKAAMAVSLIVGTLRTLADYERDPARLLSGLNRRLTSRLSEGFATCLVLRLAAGGSCILANAGHLSPFLNGRELPVTPSLPVGIVGAAEYEDQTITLEPGDRLAIYTDGVLEARNMVGELYGFDRLASLLAPNPDAATIAEAACAFGQDDDITVLTLERTATASPLSLISEAVTA